MISNRRRRPFCPVIIYEAASKVVIYEVLEELSFLKQIRNERPVRDCAVPVICTITRRKRRKDKRCQLSV